MPIAHVMIGAPGSGKSVAAKQLAAMFDSVIVSTDAIRGELFGDESIQGDWHLISSEVKRRVRCAAGTGTNIVLDATHARKRHRRDSIKLLREAGFDRIVPILMHPPLETCLERNSQRERKVPQRVIIQMWETINQNLNQIRKEFDN